MWINAEERKPDDSRLVIVKGIITYRKSRGEEDAVGTAKWLDFDQRWQNAVALNFPDTAIGMDVTHWMNLDDLFELPIEGEQREQSKIAVHVGLIPLGCSTIEMLDWALETTLESIVYAESNIRWNEAQDQSTDDATKWLEKCTKTYQRLYTMWERRTNESV